MINTLLMVALVSAAPCAQCSRFSTVIDHDVIVCGRFLFLIYNKQGSALASN